MIILMKLIGIGYVWLAIVFLIKPKAMEAYFRFWIKEKRLIFGGIVSFIFGLIFFFASKYCQWTGFFVLLGIIALLKGVIIFILGEKKMIQIFKEIIGISPGGRRILSLFALGLGILMIIAA